MQHYHIFQKAWLTSTQMIRKVGAFFLTQFLMSFHMVWSVLLQVLASKATEIKVSDWLLKLLEAFLRCEFQGDFGT